MAKKATNYEIIQRVKLVIDLLLDGLTRYEICHYASKPRDEFYDEEGKNSGWGMSFRQTDRYIRFANKRIERMANKAEQEAFDKIRTRIEKQYRRAVQAKDGHLARLLIQDMRKLYALDKAPKAAVDNDGKPVPDAVHITTVLAILDADTAKQISKATQGGNGVS